MRTFTTADLYKKVGDITDAARREPVLLTHHRKPRFVLMSVETYESLTQDKAPTSAPGFTLETMPDDVTQGLLALADQYEREDLDGGPEHSPQSGGRLRPSRHSTVFRPGACSRK